MNEAMKNRNMPKIIVKAFEEKKFVAYAPIAAPGTVTDPPKIPTFQSSLF